ncbi:MAG: hypothetical protein ACJAYY_000267 [Paraglaciecola sp.]|jgi:hypothetical protein|uniref:hypothetical protein n=1 Tax=Polaribacter sp. TaxID=1920175 RepID=UPI003AC05C02
MKLVNPTWLELKPNEDNDGNQEDFSEYYKRIKNTKLDLGKFPKEVYEQWIHPHYKNGHTLNNYSWLDYELISFELVEWNYDQLKTINVIESFSSYTNQRGNFRNLNNFCCIEKDLNFWRNHGTWRIPPIILDIKSLGENTPKWCELKGNYQLVEGHSRFGYLNSMSEISKQKKYKIAKKHKFYLMKKSTNA